jgi:acyl carrier protein
MGETEVGAELRAELRAYIEEAFLYLHPDVELRDEDQFLELGVIDSLGFVELVEEVQTRYGIAVDDALEITEENFGSLGALVAFVERRRGT